MLGSAVGERDAVFNGVRDLVENLRWKARRVRYSEITGIFRNCVGIGGDQMGWHMTLVVCGTMVSAGVALMLPLWIDIPSYWAASLLAGMPAFVCLLIALAPRAWVRWKSSRQDPKPEELEKFLVSVRYFDREWHQPLELASRFGEQTREFFGEMLSEVGEHYDSNDLPRNWQYKVASEITADSIRIMDSVLSQLRAGHPDTALGTVRQLFELSISIKVIALDPSGESAKLYIDTDEIDYLDKSVKRGSSRETEIQRILESVKEDSGIVKVRGQYPWITLDNGQKPDKMEDVIEYITDKYYCDSSERQAILNRYMKQWETLNKWAHISKSASRRKLGTRIVGGYLQEHLVEKSNVGYDTPLSIGIALLHSTLTSCAYIFYHLTKTEHNSDLDELDGIIRQIDMSLDSVPFELLANDFRLKWLSPP